MDLLSFTLVHPTYLERNCEREIILERQESCTFLLKPSNVYGEERSFSKMQAHGEFRGLTYWED